MAVTFGTLASGARTTVSPLLSFFSVSFGRFSGRAAPGGGGVFCCAVAGKIAVKAMAASVETENSLFNLSRFILVASLRLGFCFGHSIDHSAVFRNKIFLRCGFDLLAR